MIQITTNQPHRVAEKVSTLDLVSNGRVDMGVGEASTTTELHPFGVRYRDKREIFEEGIRIPPTKIIKNDELQEDILELILHNCRLPHWNRSDFNALVAAIRTAEKRVIEMAERFGDDVFYSALDELLERNKRILKSRCIGAIGNGIDFFGRHFYRHFKRINKFVGAHQMPWRHSTVRTGPLLNQREWLIDHGCFSVVLRDCLTREASETESNHCDGFR